MKEKEEPWFVVFAHFCDVNTLTMAESIMADSLKSLNESQKGMRTVNPLVYAKLAPVHHHIRKISPPFSMDILTSWSDIKWSSMKG